MGFLICNIIIPLELLVFGRDWLDQVKLWWAFANEHIVLDVYDLHSKRSVFYHNKKAFSKLCHWDFTP
jgi:hypothetical protein